MFSRNILIIAILLAVCEVAALDSSNDTIVFNRILSEVGNSQDKNSSLMVKIAVLFLGTPYVSDVLENGDDKRVVANIDKLDCVTFVETVTGIYLCAMNSRFGYESYVDYIKQLRYRDGKPDGYDSRLHYFSDWLISANKNGVLDFVSDTSIVPTKKKINFMTKNKRRYRQLKRKRVFQKMKEIERLLSKTPLPYVIAEKIDQTDAIIQDGDIIAFSSSISGLDVSHVGIACRNSENGALHFIHASTSVNKVVVSSESVQEYVLRNRGIDGIIVGRLK